MEKKQKILTFIIVTFAVADLIYGWLAIAADNFSRGTLVPGIAALIAGLVGALGLVFNKPWVFGGGAIALFVFCPSPLAFIPLLVGSILLTLYAVTVYNAQDGAHD